MTDLLRRTSAVFSPCRTWRVRLDRVWDDRLPPFSAGLLNPSTADEERNDPTVDRVERRAFRLGFGSLILWNAFAFRATDPDVMMAAADPVGPGNDEAIEAILVEVRERRGTVLVGWGVGGYHNDRDLAVLAIADRVGVPLFCLGTTAAGQPRHPLYIRNDEPLRPWPRPARAGG